MGPIATAILSYTKHRNCTLKDLAKEIGIGHETIRNLAFEKTDFQMKTFYKLIDFFQWDAEEVGQAMMYTEHLKGKPPRGRPRKRRPDGTPPQAKPESDSNDHGSRR